MSQPLRAGAAALAAAAVTLTVALPAQAATHNAFGGSAWASTASVGSIAKSGKTSYVPLCTLNAPRVVSNNTAALDLGAVGRVGAATTKVTSAKKGKTRTAQAVTKTGSTSLLGGLVTAQAITSTATVKKKSSHYTQTGSSVFVGLTVGGRSVSATPKPNTKVTVPGVATVVLNAQSTANGVGGHSAGTLALRVTLLAGNTLGLPAGSVLVGAANASLQKATHARPYGSAFGTQLDAAGVVGSGRTAAVYLPCGGSDGKTVSNVVTSVDVPGVLHADAVKSTGTSKDKSSSTKAETAASLAKADLLGGVVTVDGVKVSATATRKHGKVKTSSSGTALVGLKINGKSVAVSDKENVAVAVAGVGTLYLHRVTRTKTSTTVYGAQLVLNTDTLGLAKGTVLTIGSATAGVSAS